MTPTPPILRVLHLVMDQAANDLASAHAEICKLQGLDPAKHQWPVWSSPANTLRWFDDLRKQYPLTALSPKEPE